MTAPDGSEAWRTACAAAAEGDRARVVACWERVAASAPSDDARRAWALLLGSVGALDEARAALRGGDADPVDPTLAALLDGSSDDPTALEESQAEPSDDEALAAIVERAEPSAADRRLVETFLRFFGGRRDLYAVQWYDERRRRSGYRPVHEPLTEEAVRDHLAGRRTLGQYLLDASARVHFALLDLDLSADAMAALRAQHGDEATALQHAPLREHTRTLMRLGATLGLPLFPEDSGGRGVHLWLFFDPPRPARAARSLLGQLLAAAPAPPPGIGVEIYPRQDIVGPRGLSSLVKLPLGLHRVTLRRCALLDDELRPLPDADALARLRPVPADAADAVLGRRVVPLPAPELDPRPAPLPPLPTAPTPRSLAEALRALEGDAADAACERMLAGCAILRTLVERAHTERRLDADAWRALVYTIGLVGPDNRVIERALVAAGASRQPLDRVRRGLPNPMGCERLRKLPGVPQCRGCPPTAEARPYPTPALFAVGARDPDPPRHAPFAPWLDADADVLASPLQGLADALCRIEARLERLERAMPSAGGASDEGPREPR